MTISKWKLMVFAACLMSIIISLFIFPDPAHAGGSKSIDSNVSANANPPSASTSISAPNPNMFQKSQSTTVLGGALGASMDAGVPTSNNQVSSTISVSILGVAIQALMALSTAPNTIGGTTYTEYFSFGKRVFSESYHSTSGPLSYSLGLSPAEVRVPVIAYPIGPLLLEIDGGARFQANLNTAITPNLGIPLDLSSIGLQLTADAAAAGFVEGYAKFLFVRGGVGGQVDLIDANASVNGRFSFDGNPPVVFLSAMAQFLKGRFYAFVDFFLIFPWSWRRLIDYDLYNWKGYCFAAGSTSCPIN